MLPPKQHQIHGDAEFRTWTATSPFCLTLIKLWDGTGIQPNLDSRCPHNLGVDQSDQPFIPLMHFRAFAPPS